MNIGIVLLIFLLLSFLVEKLFIETPVYKHNYYHKSYERFYNEETDIYRIQSYFNIIRALMFGINFKFTDCYVNFELNFLCFNYQLTVIYSMKPFIQEEKKEQLS
jgi:hypothetical protein